MSNRKYPRFGGDHKIEQFLPEVQEQHTFCECCLKDVPVTHGVDVQIDRFRGDDDVYFVCAYHVGLARRFHTFQKFLDQYQKRNKT